MNPLFDLNVVSTQPLPAPSSLRHRHAASSKAEKLIEGSRQTIEAILQGRDKRHLLVLGPCSIHDRANGISYAERLAPLAREVADRIFLVMRVYFEKPRTSVGWKGLIMDPHLDGSADINSGIELAREILLEVLERGLPTATELLDPITPQYIADLLSWSAIGARTTESQTHRQMASGLSMPVGFKNLTSGDVQAAVNAIKAARQPQTFLGVDSSGNASSVTTRGNPFCHIVLRGGDNGPNYHAEAVRSTVALLRKSGLAEGIMVDCSHANSGKDPARQGEVFREVITAIREKKLPVIGTMIESHLEEGAQSFPQPKESLRHGLSITDACMGWERTESLVREAYRLLGSH